MKVLLDQTFPALIATRSRDGHQLERYDNHCDDLGLIEAAADGYFDVVVMLGTSVLADEILLDRCAELKIALAATAEEDPAIGVIHVTANLRALAQRVSPGVILVVKAREVAIYLSQPNLSQPI